ncbi:BTB/POZ protein [Rhizophagus clarus]|uniref:BTB/POZ protein n=1 Tax=Rhizophagus clarus TaxID=94130 RepID=A0A8H3QY40_9GLOM|nr:BTB/POZ protein [Rhizophagus clarus]
MTHIRENDGTLVQIKLPNILPEIFQIILRYIYGGEPTLKDCDNLDIIKILVAASELNIQEFYDLTSKEFSDYILPYKEILSEELYMDLLKTFLNLHPNSKPTHKSNSRIIEKRLTTSASTDNEKEPSSWSSVLPQTSSSFDSWDLREKTKKTDQTSDSWNLRVKTHQESKYPWRRESTHQESKNPQRTESTHQESKNPRIRESTHQESKNPRIRESTHQESKNPRRTESTRQESKNLWGHSSTDKEPDTLGCAVN